MHFRKSFSAWIAGALMFNLCAAVTSGTQAQTMAPPTNQSPTDALKLPPNYRNLIAQAVIFQYVRTAKGRPEISEQRSGRAMDFCVRFPVPKMAILLETTTGTQMRSFHMAISRNIFGRLAFSYEGAQLFDSACTGTLKPFPELEALGNQVKACREKTGKDCGVDAFSLPKAQREIEKQP